MWINKETRPWISHLARWFQERLYLRTILEKIPKRHINCFIENSDKGWDENSGCFLQYYSMGKWPLSCYRGNHNHVQWISEICVKWWKLLWVLLSCCQRSQRNWLNNYYLPLKASEGKRIWKVWKFGNKSVEDKQECIIEFRNRIEHPVVIWLTRCVQCGGVSVKGCECSGNFSLKTCVFINKNLFVI